ncbi:MAG: sel1 repeat family protein [archaeon]|nr:sel1 repeat family protein [archaeon]
MAVQIDIWGCCVSRDIFSIGHRLDGAAGNRYNIRCFYQECSYVSALSEHISKDITAEDLSRFELTDFFKKCITADYNKTVIDAFCDSGSDWLVIDLRTLMYGFIELLSPDGKVEYCTDGGPLKQESKYALLRELNPGFTVNHISFGSFDHYPFLVKFTDLIKERYGKNIILVAVEEAYDYLDKNGKLVNRTSVPESVLTEREIVLELLYLLDCHYIKYPFNCLADETHKWGLSQVHYVNEYYDYALDCVDIIVSGKDVMRRLDRRYLEAVSVMDSIRLEHKVSAGNALVRAEAMSKTKRYAEAFVLYKELAGCGVNMASLHLGRAYLHGYGVERDYAKAIMWLDKAVKEYRIPEGCPDLFTAIWKVNNVSRLKEVFELALLYSSKGDIRCTWCIGKAYRYGKGTAKDLAMAEKCFLEAYDKGLRGSLRELFAVWWVFDDPEHDRMLWDMASQLDNPVAKRYVGLMYRDGRHVGKDLVRAEACLKESAESGNKEAAVDLAGLKGLGPS